VLELRSIRNEFTCSCSFLARLLVSGPGFVIFMLDGEWLSLEEARMAEMSSSWLAKFKNQCYLQSVRFKDDLRLSFCVWLDAFS
jgi:hypothetical protein